MSFYLYLVLSLSFVFSAPVYAEEVMGTTSARQASKESKEIDNGMKLGDYVLTVAQIKKLTPQQQVAYFYSLNALLRIAELSQSKSTRKFAQHNGSQNFPMAYLSKAGKTSQRISVMRGRAPLKGDPIFVGSQAQKDIDQAVEKYERYVASKFRSPQNVGRVPNTEMSKTSEEKESFLGSSWRRLANFFKKHMPFGGTQLSVTETKIVTLPDSQRGLASTQTQNASVTVEEIALRTLRELKEKLKAAKAAEEVGVGGAGEVVKTAEEVANAEEVLRIVKAAVVKKSRKEEAAVAVEEIALRKLKAAKTAEEVANAEKVLRIVKAAAVNKSRKEEAVTVEEIALRKLKAAKTAEEVANAAEVLRIVKAAAVNKSRKAAAVNKSRKEEAVTVEEIALRKLKEKLKAAKAAKEEVANAKEVLRILKVEVKKSRKEEAVTVAEISLRKLKAAEEEVVKTAEEVANAEEVLRIVKAAAAVNKSRKAKKAEVKKLSSNNGGSGVSPHAGIGSGVYHNPGGLYSYAGGSLGSYPYVRSSSGLYSRASSDSDLASHSGGGLIFGGAQASEAVCLYGGRLITVLLTNNNKVAYCNNLFIGQRKQDQFKRMCKEKDKFPCQDYGLKESLLAVDNFRSVKLESSEKASVANLSKEDFSTKLCVDLPGEIKNDKDKKLRSTLTQRCSAALSNWLVESSVLAMDTEQYAKFSKKLRSHLNEFIHGEVPTSSQPIKFKTLSQYCNLEALAHHQKEECASVQKIVATLCVVAGSKICQTKNDEQWDPWTFKNEEKIKNKESLIDGTQ